MNRLGLSLDETAAVAARMQSENHGLTLLMSHFACADQPQHPLNDQQIRQFREIRTLFRGIPGSLANSSGIFLDQSAYCDMVRPGAALYGINPTPGKPNPDEAGDRAARPRAAGAQRAAQRHGRLWRDMDGEAREPHRRGRRGLCRRHFCARRNAVERDVIVAGKRCRIVGRISMDLLTVDVTDLPDNAVRRGHLVTLIGGELAADAVGAQAGTIGYEVLTSLGRALSQNLEGLIHPVRDGLEPGGARCHSQLDQQDEAAHDNRLEHHREHDRHGDRNMAGQHQAHPYAQQSRRPARRMPAARSIPPAKLA